MKNKKIEYKKLKDVVYNYKTKHEHGFTKTEIENLLEKLNINEKKFNKSLGINTCMIVDGEVITYHTDILKGIVCAIEGRLQNSIE